MSLCKAPDNCKAADVVAKVKCCLAGPVWKETDRTQSNDVDRTIDTCQRCGQTRQDIRQ